MKKIVGAAAGLLLTLTPTTAFAAQIGVHLTMVVPQICTVNPLSLSYVDDTSIKIDEIREFCNSGGYQIYLDYAPGTLKGAQASLGDYTVELDGSGEALLVDAHYAVSRISSFEIAQLHTNDTNVQLGLRMVPR
ncbi:hypothetical protein [Parasphingopyxis sp.]|uniref:hypothetical protein n=1 Tax=Parasphingopyxis sp. TaxID=1920299 RepID=UPI00261A7D97|nr:hypothetical protein [Parasphingopyxis sp.]